MKPSGCALALLLLSTAAVAAPTSRDEKIAQLLRATGMAETIEEMREIGHVEASNMAKQIANGMLKDTKAQSDEQQTQINAAVQRFADALVTAMDLQNAMKSWGRLYAAQLSDQELDEVLRYYLSPTGQKDVAATKAVMPKWKAEVASKGRAAAEGAMERLKADLKQIATPQQ